MRGSVEVKVSQVGFDPLSNSPVVILQDKDSERTMRIWIGMAEAQAIALQLQGTMPPRPLTHDLVKTILEQIGVEIDKVLVSELKGSTYYARIHLMNGRRAMEVDSRPSDAIALALRFHRPIFVAHALFNSAPVSGGKNYETGTRETGAQMSVRLLGMTVQDLTDSLAAYFDLSQAEGVLIVDVANESGDKDLQRGDVIVSINGEKVRNIKELRKEIEQTSKETLTLQVIREGKEIHAILAAPKESATSDARGG